MRRVLHGFLPLIAVGLFAIAGISVRRLPAVAPASSSPRDAFLPPIAADTKELFANDDVLRAYVQTYGPTQTVRHLNELVPEFGSCHDPAHKAGRFAYEHIRDRAFRECSAECHSGCYHGAVEAFFRDQGTANLAENLRTLCSSELNPFFSHQCVHGIGHGLLAWADYGLFDALKACDLLPREQNSCWTGVFMENIVASLGSDSGHRSRYLRNDPEYPCTIVDERYKGACYFLQTSRMLELFAGDFQEVAVACARVSPSYQQVCFESMGRDVGGAYREAPERAIATCELAYRSDARLWCLSGAVQDTFWDPSGQDRALAFCRHVTDPRARTVCYETIINRAPHVLASPEVIRRFCARVDPIYRDQCLHAIDSDSAG